MSEKFVVYIYSPKHNVSEETIRKTIRRIDSVVEDAFDGNVYDFDKVEK